MSLTELQLNNLAADFSDRNWPLINHSSATTGIGTSIYDHSRQASCASGDTILNHHRQLFHKPSNRELIQHNNPTDDPLSSTSSDLPLPPNGGLQAWLQVLATCMLSFNTYGITTTFGIFQTHYQTAASPFTASSPSAISQIGALQSFLALSTPILTAQIYDRGYLRPLLITGTSLIVSGHIILSFCTSYWQVLLTQGICIGLGIGCLIVPSISILPTYFTGTRLNLALGLAASGSSFGGVIYPIVVSRLIARTGFPWSVRVMGFLSLATLLLPITLARMRGVQPPKPRALVDWTAFRDLPFVFFVVATFIGFIGPGIASFYISFYTEDRITSGRLSDYILPILNAASGFGHFISTVLADKMGVFNILPAAAVIVGVLAFTLIGVHSQTSIIIVTIIYGLFTGVVIALPPICMAALTKDESMVGTRVGQGHFVVAFGMLVGGPGAGGGLWGWGGAMALVSGGLFFGVRVALFGFGGNVKV